MLNLINEESITRINQVNIGILGLGTVGTGVARILLEQRDLLKARTGLTFNLRAIAELNWDNNRNLNFTRVKCTTNANELLNDPGIDIIVETIGGCETAYHYIKKALENRKHVVTANKALLASKGRELFEKAQAHGVSLLFEASVGGGIPIIKGLREGLVANQFETIYGILNGTANYILTKMHQDGLELHQALREAQAKGFAEADPTLDISGGDTGHKLSILASIAASNFVDLKKIHIEGITDISKIDIEFAKKLGCAIKLLAIYKLTPEGLDVRVHPALVPDSHLLAAVNNELNAIFVKGDFVGETMFYGPGAGQNPTASAVVGDLVDLSRDILMNANPWFYNRLPNLGPEMRIIPISKTKNRYYLRFSIVTNEMLPKFSDLLNQFGIHVTEKIQSENQLNRNDIRVVFLTDEVVEETVNAALDRIRKSNLGSFLTKLRLFG